MERYIEWMRRSMGVVSGMPLGGPGELWRVIPKNPANEWVSQRVGFDDPAVAYYTSRTLLHDVVHAAGAIEYTVGRIDAASEAVHAYAEKHGAKSSSADVPTGLVTIGVDQAYIEYANLLNWLRTLIDRMRSTHPFSGAKLGLIPALSPEMPLLRGVETVFDRFQRHPLIVGEALLTNFGLHLHALPGGGSPRATMTTDGCARLLIPDKPRERVYLFDQFTYEEERELLEFAHGVLSRVEVFIDELLSAFEEGTKYAMSQRQQTSA